MTRDALLRRGLRGLAVAIAIAAIWDPSIASHRATKPSVVVVAGDSLHDHEATDRVRGALAKRLAVSSTVVAGSDAAIVVGDRIPSNATDLPAPTFVVSPNVSTPDVALISLDAPAITSTVGRVAIPAVVRVRNARAKNVELTLRAGDVAVDRVTLPPTRDDDTLTVPLAFVPTTAGIARLSAVASVSGKETARAEAATEVRDGRWSVLFFDGRPSWTSTFVRRTLERDPRVDVTSRTVTSKNISTEAGTPPPRLDDLSTIASFDAIVVGAPDGLSPSDVAGLENYLRRRGGSVVLLLDQTAPSPIDRLAAVARWNAVTLDKPAAISFERDSSALRVAALAIPSPNPIGLAIIAGTIDRPAVWREPVGAGHLIVSGALDAWRFRDSTESSFDRFWRMTIVGAAAESPAPVSADISTRIVQPGANVRFEVRLRDAVLHAPSTASKTSIVVTADSTQQVRVYPAANGVAHGEFRAPRRAGTHRIDVLVDGKRADAAFIVATDPAPLQPASAPLVAAWAASRGGGVFSENHLDSLAAQIEAAAAREPHLVVWHPMRSPWWLLPFILALSAEWWLRRRRGLR